VLLYVAVGIAYIAVGVNSLGFLYSSFLGVGFCFLGVWVMPRLWQRLRRRPQ
jgi:Na+/phosphate symporter